MKDQWRLYQAEKFPSSWHEEFRVDVFWAKVLATASATVGELKYGLLKKVVCSSLTIQNGNADCERSLSDNKNTLSAERTNLGPETLMGLRRMKEHARSLGGAHMVPTTSRDMLKAVKSSHQNYIKRKEKEQAEKRQLQLITERNAQEQSDNEAMLSRESLQKQRLDEKEKQLEIKEKKNCNDQDVAQKLLDEASKSLDKAIEDNNMIGIKVAREMLQTAKNNMEKALQQKKDNLKLRQKVSSKRKNALKRMVENAKKKAI